MLPPKIAACLIVKNAEDTIEQCLATVRPFVDGVFVYDTGSTDGTIAVLERLNERRAYADTDGRIVEPTDARPEQLEAASVTEVPLAPIVVEQGEWRDDFAWAREQNFAMPDDTYDWLLWLDDDDHIEGAQSLRYLAATARPEIDGFIAQYDYARDQVGQCVCVLWRERLMRRAAGYTWKNAVHEVLVPPDGKAPVLVTAPPNMLRYVHRRDLVPDRYDPERNLNILRAEQERAAEAGEPVDPRTLAYLGTEHMAKADFATGAGFLDEYLKHPAAAWSDERAQVAHKLATCLRALGNPQAAIHTEMQATTERDDWAENAIGLAQSFGMLGQWDRAERWARRGLELGIPQTPLILNPLEFALIPWLVIAEACVNQAKPAEARAAIAQAGLAAPANPDVQATTGRLEQMLAENAIVDAIHLLRETLVRHDENLKAYYLLESVPYIVSERPEVVKARADQRGMVAHYLKPDEYAAWYREVPKESTVDDEWVPDIGEHIPRAKRVLEMCQAFEAEHGRKPRVLDLGANDMWLACYLWSNGEYVADGVELNNQSIEKGCARLEKFGAPGVYVQGDLHKAAWLLNEFHGEGGAGPREPNRLVANRTYDIVTLFEVLEHVPDTNKTIDVMESLCAPGGQVCISTPNGAYERGQIDAWHRVEYKGHLRAIPIHDLADQLLNRGNLTMLELQHDNRVAFVAYTPAKRKGTITFYAGASWEDWSPASVNDGGLGGSETALVHLSLLLSEQGYRVKIYSGAQPGIVGGVLYRPFTSWDPTEEADLLVVSRMPHVVDNPIGARKTALWCHDHSYPGQLTEERAAKIDHIVCLSDWQKDRFERLYPFAADKLMVIRNGIAPEAMGEPKFPDADRPFAERAPRCVFASSADRGLDVMLDVWPRVREDVPDAELHVFYGFNVMDRVAQGNPGLALYKQQLLARVEALGGEDGGVHLRGRVGQAELATEMQQARVLSYPTGFLETSCITAMEARAAGLPIVTSDLGALHETVGQHGLLIPWNAEEDEPFNHTAEYQAAFVKHVVRMLADEKAWTRWHTAGLRGVDKLSWAARSLEWARLARAGVARKTRTKVAA